MLKHPDVNCSCRGLFLAGGGAIALGAFAARAIRYSAKAAERSWASMLGLLTTALAARPGAVDQAAA